ncbi:MAG: hypothetical protein AAGA73_06365 [Pseudomonadota bacterium]
MYYLWPTVVVALLVFIARLPGTFRRVRTQLDMLRPRPPVGRLDHLPCMVNTIGVFITEFFMLGLMTLAVFILSNATISTVWRSSDIASGITYVSLGALVLMAAVAGIIGLLVKGGVIARAGLIFGALIALVTWMVLSTSGSQAPAILLFALFTVGVPTLFIALIKRFL